MGTRGLINPAQQAREDVRVGRAPNGPSPDIITDIQGISDKVAQAGLIYNTTYQAAALAKIAKESK